MLGRYLYNKMKINRKTFCGKPKRRKTLLLIKLKKTFNHIIVVIMSILFHFRVYNVLLPINRVWKGILGNRDLTKIRCGIRENKKCLDGIRDLTVTREAGFTKIWARDAGFCCLSVGNSGNRHDPKNVLAAKANQPGERKISIERANLHWERRKEIRDSDEKSAGCGILVKKERECAIRTSPFQTLY